LRYRPPSHDSACAAALAKSRQAAMYNNFLIVCLLVPVTGDRMTTPRVRTHQREAHQIISKIDASQLPDGAN
jgi:hypothetical protein